MTHRYASATFRKVDQALFDYYKEIQVVGTLVQHHKETTSAMELLAERRRELREAIAALRLDDELYQPNSLELQL